MGSSVQVSEGIFGTDSQNYSQRVPCVVIMDCSHSMDGPPIASLNEGLTRFEAELKSDDKARRSARIMLIRVGGFQGDTEEVSILCPFQDAANFSVPAQIASGSTPLGQAVLLALSNIEDEKRRLRSSGLSYHRPWLFVISDGAPTDTQVWEEACGKALAACQAKKVSIFAIAVNGGSVSELEKVSDRSVAQMSSVKFSEFFVWLSRSISGASDDAAEDPAMATGKKGWSRS